ncbi:MAG: type II toxin-antitoxin system prevent-host-death family antitoxin, partial [Bdellovibrionales bacterium]|nr:type II toxin-antitoxin system prevent-host-death family antitoxin [Bdellovibrionales bacterium]
MKSVKISELKAKISQYIREVCQGTELIITDRKRPVAKLTAI